MTELISNIRIFPLKNGNVGSLRANGKITIAGVMEVNFRVLDGREGLWIGWPGRYGEKPGENGRKPWFSDVFITDETAKQAVTELLIGEYEKQRNTAAEPSMKRSPGFPPPKKPGAAFKY